MGFYYGPGGEKSPQEDPPKGSWGDTFAIIFAVFKTLALPLGLLFGAIFGLLFLLYLFTVSAWLGLGLILLGVLGLVARGIWEAKHPPELL